MFSFKRCSILILMAAIILPVVSAQISVDESYLIESIEIMIIRETARSTTRDQKLIALEYIGEALRRGNTSDEIRVTLDFLSNEGTRSVTRENNRVVNNFPDIRRQAVKYLGQIGTEAARRSLIGVLEFEDEPLVIQEAFKALGDIGTNENNQTAISIARALNHFTATNPDQLMALAAVDALEKIANKNSGISSVEVILCLQRVSTETKYITPIRERARRLLADLRTYR